MTTLTPATICDSSSSKYLTCCLIRQRLLQVHTNVCASKITIIIYLLNQIELISPKSYDIVTLERSS